MKLMAKIIKTESHGKDYPEKANIPFAVAIAALQFGHEVQIWLQGPSVNLCRIGYTEGLVFPPFPPIRQMIEDYLSNGGKIFLCGPCLKTHQIEEKDYIFGPKPAGAALLVQESIGSTVFNY